MPAPSFVQANSFAPVAAVPTDLTVSTLADTTAGNYIVVFAVGPGIGANITDSQGNVYSFNIISNGTVTEFHVNGCIGGPLTVTLTLPGPSFGDIAIAVLEYANADINIIDQLIGFATLISEFGTCPAGSGSPDGYIVDTFDGLNLSADYAWENWLANTICSGSNDGTPQFFANNLSSVTLESLSTTGTTGAVEPVWVSGGVTNDNTAVWQDSEVSVPGDSIAILGICGGFDGIGGGAFTVNGPGWTLRTQSIGLANIAVYDRAAAPFISSVSVSIDKAVDNFDLGAQLSQVTGFPNSAPVGQKPPNYYPSEIPPVLLNWECCLDPFLGCILER